MNLHFASLWIVEHGVIIGLLAAIATAFGALYQPVRDLLKALPGFIWGVIKYSVLTAWVIIWPIRKLIAMAYGKFLSDRVDRMFDKLFDWFEAREARKEAARQPTE